MKHIHIRLNNNSVNLAIRRLENIKNRTIPLMIRGFLTECCLWIIQQANLNLDDSERGSKVIQDIKSSWSYVISENGFAKIVNSAEKAVYVEFGVGVVGGSDPHPSADMAGYDYNRPSTKKDYNGSWRFYSNENELDIPLDDVEWGVNPTSGDARRRLMVFTSGAVGDAFLYNAMIDLVSSGYIYTIWSKAKEKYLV